MHIFVAGRLGHLSLALARALPAAPEGDAGFGVFHLTGRIRARRGIVAADWRESLGCWLDKLICPAHPGRA
jgi:hypothetical protein